MVNDFRIKFGNLRVIWPREKKSFSSNYLFIKQISIHIFKNDIRIVNLDLDFSRSRIRILIFQNVGSGLRFLKSVYKFVFHSLFFISLQLFVLIQWFSNWRNEALPSFELSKYKRLLVIRYSIFSYLQTWNNKRGQKSRGRAWFSCIYSFPFLTVSDRSIVCNKKKLY